MANWNTTFSQRLSFDLENGLLGNPSDFANAITKYYVDTLLTSQIPGIPATLPAPANSGAPAPVGPITTINDYDARARIFNQTVRVYYEAKAIAQGKTSIEDTAKSINRLIIKSKRVQRDISSLIKQSKLLGEEIKRLPETLKVAVAQLLEYIKEQLDTVKSLPASLQGFKLQFGEVEFKNLFEQELTLITRVANFKPTVKLSDYRELFVLLSEFGPRIETLEKNFSSSNNFKIFIYKKLQGAISNILFVVEGLSNPSAIINFVRDLTYVKPKYKRWYRVLSYFIKRSTFLTKQQTQTKVLIKKYKLELEATLKPKLTGLRETLQKRVQENANKILKFKQSKIILNAVKTAKQYGEIVSKNYKKVSREIKKYAKIAKLVSRILAKIDALSRVIAAEILKIIEETKNLVDKTQNAIQTSSDELRLYAKEVLGITSDFIIASIVTAGAKLYLSKDDIKTIFTKSSRKINAIVTEIQTLFTKDIPELKRALYNSDRSLGLKTKRPTKTSLFSISDLFSNITNSLKELAALVNRKIKDLVEHGKKQLESSKAFVTDYVNNLTAVNAFINKKKNKAVKIDREAKEKKKQAYDAKALANLTIAGSKIIGLSWKVLANVLKKNILISQNENNLTKLINQYYFFLVLNKRIKPGVAESEKTKKLLKLKELVYSEALVFLLKNVIEELASGNFVTELKNSIEDTSLSTISNFKESFSAFESLFTKSVSFDTLVNSLDRLNLSVLNNRILIQNLYILEQKYLRKFKQTVKATKRVQQQSLVGKHNKSMLLQEFYSGVEKTNSVLLLLLELVQKAAEKAKTFIYELVRPIKEKISKTLEDRKRRQKEKVKASTKQVVEKNINIDALAMSATFEVASRLFWTGFSWTNPVGTTFIVTNIGPFKPIKALNVDGSAGYASELAAGFEGQLKLLSGIAIPNPATGIPSFPFIGYN